MIVISEPGCNSKSWNSGFGGASYKHVCVSPLDLGIEMVALSKDSMTIEDKMANSFANMGYVTSNKLYLNSQYGFSIQYPSNTQINDVDISGGRSISFTTSQGIVMVNVVKQAWNSGVLSPPPNCDDTAGGQNRTNTTINGVNFLTYSMSREMSGANSHISATEYCAIKSGTAYKVITRVNYVPGSSNGIDLDKNPVLNQMLSTFKVL